MIIRAILNQRIDCIGSYSTVVIHVPGHLDVAMVSPVHSKAVFNIPIFLSIFASISHYEYSMVDLKTIASWLVVNS